MTVDFEREERERAEEARERARERAEEEREAARERAEQDREAAREAAERARELAEARRERTEQERRRRRERGRYRRDERKERVLHTRISEPLAEDIRRIAEELRVPVSNIVRNVLEEAFSVVESVTENVGDLIEDVVDEADRAAARVRHHRFRQRARRHARDVPETGAVDPTRARGEHSEDAGDTEETDWEQPGRRRSQPPEFPDVVGWQPLILNRDQSCADCGDTLERRDPAFVGMTGAGLSATYLCQDCMDRR